MNLKNLVFSILLFVFAANCSKDEDDECYSTTDQYFSDVIAPSTAQINEEVVVATFFSVINGCGGFNKFRESSTARNTTIELQVRYVGCVCTQNVPNLNQDYIFKAEEPGTYQLNFNSGESDFITVYITVG